MVGWGWGGGEVEHSFLKDVFVGIQKKYIFSKLFLETLSCIALSMLVYKSVSFGETNWIQIGKFLGYY